MCAKVLFSREEGAERFHLGTMVLCQGLSSKGGSMHHPGSHDIGPFARESLTEYHGSQMKALGPFKDEHTALCRCPQADLSPFFFAQEWQETSARNVQEASLQFLSETKVPAPKVFDFNFCEPNPVGVGYILMEKLPGHLAAPLAEKWRWTFEYAPAK
jgi:hypothetical protein